MEPIATFPKWRPPHVESMLQRRVWYAIAVAVAILVSASCVVTVLVLRAKKAPQATTSATSAGSSTQSQSVQINSLGGSMVINGSNTSASVGLPTSNNATLSSSSNGSTGSSNASTSKTSSSSTGGTGGKPNTGPEKGNQPLSHNNSPSHTMGSTTGKPRYSNGTPIPPSPNFKLLNTTLNGATFQIPLQAQPNGMSSSVVGTGGSLTTTTQKVGALAAIPVIGTLAQIATNVVETAQTLTVQKLQETVSQVVNSTTNEIKATISETAAEVQKTIDKTASHVSEVAAATIETPAEQRTKNAFVAVAKLDIKTTSSDALVLTGPNGNQTGAPVAGVLTIQNASLLPQTPLEIIEQKLNFKTGVLTGKSVTPFDHGNVGAHALQGHVANAAGAQHMCVKVVGFKGEALAGMPVRGLVVNMTAVLGDWIKKPGSSLSAVELAANERIQQLLDYGAAVHQNKAKLLSKMIADKQSTSNSSVQLIDDVEANLQESHIDDECQVLDVPRVDSSEIVATLMTMHNDKYHSAPGGSVAMESVMTKLVTNALPHLQCLKPGQTAVSVMNSEHIGPLINDLLVVDASIDGVREPMRVQAVRTAFTLTPDGRLALDTEYVLYTDPIWRAIRDVVREDQHNPTTDFLGNDVSASQYFTEEDKAYARHLHAFGTNLIVDADHLEALDTTDQTGRHGVFVIDNGPPLLESQTAAVQKTITNGEGSKVDLVHTILSFESPNLFRPFEGPETHEVPVLIAGNRLAFASRRVLLEAVEAKLFATIEEAVMFCGARGMAQEKLGASFRPYKSRAKDLFAHKTTITTKTEGGAEIKFETAEDIDISLVENKNWFKQNVANNTSFLQATALGVAAILPSIIGSNVPTIATAVLLAATYSGAFSKKEEKAN